jgi:hypothetical protein
LSGDRATLPNEKDVNMKIRLLIGIAFVLALAVMALAADQFVGTWKLNVAKSKFPPGQAPKSVTFKVEAQDNGLKWVTDSVEADGKPSHWQYSAKYDGKDYRVTGATDTDTIALTKINASTFTWVEKKDRKETSGGRNVISNDGKTMTVTLKGKNAQGQDISETLVVDKQ